MIYWNVLLNTCQELKKNNKKRRCVLDLEASCSSIFHLVFGFGATVQYVVEIRTLHKDVGYTRCTCRYRDVKDVNSQRLSGNRRWRLMSITPEL